MPVVELVMGDIWLQVLRMERVASGPALTGSLKLDEALREGTSVLKEAARTVYKERRPRRRFSMGSVQQQASQRDAWVA